MILNNISPVFGGFWEFEAKLQKDECFSRYYECFYQTKGLTNNSI